MIEGLQPLSEEAEAAMRDFDERMAESIANEQRGGLIPSEHYLIMRLEQRVAELERLVTGLCAVERGESLRGMRPPSGDEVWRQVAGDEPNPGENT